MLKPVYSKKTEITLRYLRNNYDSIYLSKKTPWKSKIENRQLRNILNTRDIAAGKKVLDLGCGAGNNVKYLSEKGFKVIGVDFSFQALRMAKKTKITSPLILADASRLPFKNSTFDFIIDIGCFHSLLPFMRGKVKKEILRILKINGLYFLRLWYSHLSGHNILAPLFCLRGKIPVYGFNLPLVKNIFKKSFKFQYLKKEIDADEHSQFLILLLKKTNK